MLFVKGLDVTRTLLWMHCFMPMSRYGSPQAVYAAYWFVRFLAFLVTGEPRLKPEYCVLMSHNSDSSRL